MKTILAPKWALLTLVFIMASAFAVSGSAQSANSSRLCSKLFNRNVIYEGSTYVPTEYATIYQCCSGGACQNLTLPERGSCVMYSASWGSFTFILDSVQGPNECGAYSQLCARYGQCTKWCPAGTNNCTNCSGTRYPSPYSSVMSCSTPEP
jgi:hypothetical protein